MNESRIIRHRFFIEWTNSNYEWFQMIDSIQSVKLYTESSFFSSKKKLSLTRKINRNFFFTKSIDRFDNLWSVAHTHELLLFPLIHSPVQRIFLFALIMFCFRIWMTIYRHILYQIKSNQIKSNQIKSKIYSSNL